MTRTVRYLALVLPLAWTVACGGKKGGSKSKAEDPAPGPAEPAAPASPPATPETPAQDPYAALYEPQNVPPKFAVAMPGSILIDTGAGLRLQEDPELAPEAAPDAVAPDESSSHGLQELAYQADNLSYRIGLFAFDLIALDQLYLEHPECLEAAGCTIAAAEVTMNREMVNYAVDAAGGHQYVSAADLEWYLSMVGQPWTLGNVVVAHPATHPQGYTTVATIANSGDGFTSSREYGYTADFSKVGIVFDDSGSYTWEVEGAAPQTFSYSYGYKLLFDATLGALRVTEDSEYGDGGKWTNDFAFQVDPERVATSGVFFSVTLKYAGSQADGFFTELTGTADDNGAYIRTIYKYDTYDYTLTLDGNAEAYSYYNIYPAGTTAADIAASEYSGALSVGSFSGAADGLGGAEWPWYSGPTTLPAGGLEVFETTWSWDETTGESSESVVDAGFNVTAVTAVKTQISSGYEEIVDANGEVTSYCHYDNGDFTLEPYCFGPGVEGEYVDYYSAEVGADGEYKPAGYVEISISGVTFADVEGQSLYIFRDAAAVDALTAAWATEAWEDDEAAWQNVIGDAYYVGTGTEVGTEALDTVYAYSYYGTAAEAATAVVGRMMYDDVTGEAFFEAVTGAVVTATVVE